MKNQRLNSLLEPKKNELTELNGLLKSTRKQIDDAVEQGNTALLDLKDEFEELAEKKRNLIRQIEKLEDAFEKLNKKIKYVENTYGGYLDIIKGGKDGEQV